MGRLERDWQRDKDDDVRRLLQRGGIITGSEDDKCRHPGCEESPFLTSVYCSKHRSENDRR